MGFLETLGHLKNPSSPPFGPVHRALLGLPYNNIVPVNRYVHLIFLCLYMHYPIIPIIMYTYWLIIPSKKENFCCAFDINLPLKRMHFT